MRLRRFSIALLLTIVLLAFISFMAQSACGQATPTFEVASVRPSKPGSPQHANVPLDSGNVYSNVSSDGARTAAGGLMIATHQPLWRYLSFAFKLSGTQELALRFNIFSGAPKSGAPFWVTGGFDSSPEYFDISARASSDTSIDQMRLMMQALLAERFRLLTHSASANVHVFALVPVKLGATGPQLQLHAPSDVCTASLPGQSPALSHSTSIVGEIPPFCGIIAHVASLTPGQHYGGRAIPLSLLATSIPTMTGLAVMPRPVVDQTGLSGLYDFNLTWMHDPSGDAAISENAASFREALKNQLGLELKSSQAPIRFLIIDHVEKPSEN